MNQLSAEGLVIKAPRRGVIAITLSEENLKEHYDLTRILLTHELESLDAVARRKLPEYEPIATALHRLRWPIDVSTLARYTGEIFAAIGSLREISQAIIAIRVANDHLYYIRTVECQHLEDVQTELIRLCELLLAGDCEELVAAIEDYYDRRIELLPSLMAVARQ